MGAAVAEETGEEPSEEPSPERKASEQLQLSRSPGVGVHECGLGPPLGRASLQDLVDFVLVVDRHLLQASHHHSSLGDNTAVREDRGRPGGWRNSSSCSATTTTEYLDW